MSPDTAGSGEHHLTVAALVQPRALVCPQVAVEAPAADEGLAALVANEGSLSCVIFYIILYIFYNIYIIYILLNIII